jgi:hypothetical protein
MFAVDDVVSAHFPALEGKPWLRHSVSISSAIPETSRSLFGVVHFRCCTWQIGLNTVGFFHNADFPGKTKLAFLTAFTDNKQTL